MKNKEKATGLKGIDKAKLFIPLGVWIIGIIVLSICAPLSTNVNAGVGLGFLILMVGTVMLAVALYREIFRIGIETPFPLNRIFPSYPIVDDSDDVGKHISGFRSSVNDFLSKSSVQANSSLQDYSSQLLWHSLFLWKKRMEKHGISLSLVSNRRAYTSKKNSLRCGEYFDGRYIVKDVCEEIDSRRIFRYKDHDIKTLHDKEVAHYTLLSAKETENNKIVCPNCGSVTTRSNLIDGCDYCGTKFSVEDMENSVGDFGFRRDFSVSESKSDAVKELIYPWVFVVTEMPYVYFGFFGAFLYMDESLIARFFTGIVAAGLLGLFGLFCVKINMAIVLPIAYIYFKSHEKMDRKMAYRSKEALEQEQAMAEYVRQFDSKFSIQSFFGGVQNKLMAIHYADKEEQINAFSEVDLSKLLGQYSNVVDVDVSTITLDSYELLEGSRENPDGDQKATVKATAVIRDFINGAIIERSENIELKLVKNGRCRTQAVCGPSILQCKKCGASLSLMEGKKCAYCGNELDLKKYDWVITDYNSRFVKI